MACGPGFKIVWPEPLWHRPNFWRDRADSPYKTQLSRPRGSWLTRQPQVHPPSADPYGKEPAEQAGACFMLSRGWS